MSSINTVTISGRVGREPEARHTPSGMCITTFSIAVHGYSKDGDDPTYWIDCKCFKNLAELISQKVPKGGRLVVNGQLQQEKWTDKATGGNRSKLVVVANSIDIIDWRDDTQAHAPDQHAPPAHTSAPEQTQTAHGKAPPATRTINSLVDEEKKDQAKIEYDDIPF